MVCILQSADLPVQFSNLSRERVDLLDGLGNIKIQIALLLGKIVGRVVKAVCEVACGGENRLAQRQACGIRSKLAEAAEEVRNLRADVAAAAGKVNFDLLHAGDECVQLPLLLGLFLNAQLQNGVAQALQLLQADSGAERERANYYGIILGQNRLEPRITGRVYIGEIRGDERVPEHAHVEKARHRLRHRRINHGHNFSPAFLSKSCSTLALR